MKKAEKTNRIGQRLLLLIGMAGWAGAACSGSPSAESSDVVLASDFHFGESFVPAEDILLDSVRELRPELEDAPDTVPGELLDQGGWEVEVIPSGCQTDGGPYCPCTLDLDCLTGKCLPGPEGLVCGQPCQATCPAGWECVLEDGSEDNPGFCVSLLTWLCRPCTASVQCFEPAFYNGSHCVEQDGVGAWCGSACEDSQDCPEGFICRLLTSTEGIPVHQCTPVQGLCPCTQRFADMEAATWCQNENTLGLCSGLWTCQGDGDGECSARTPAWEQCNGIDDNCDGVTDPEQSSGCTQYYEDLDEDGYGANQGKCLCGPEAPYTATEFNDCAPLDPLLPNCQGKNCGPDGCGGVCGTCPDGVACESGLCGCQPDCSAKSCGDDGCGGSCGSCETLMECTAGGQCICQFTSCSGLCCPEGAACHNEACCWPDCEGLECGDDGCGDNCGTCPASHTCVNGQCLCQPSCGLKECGPDGCGGDCGTCPEQTTCVNGFCVCQTNCEGRNCGDDGCGGSCGACEDTDSCVDGVCTCTPACEGRECGPNGCGGLCGTCPPGSPCQTFSGHCICVPACGESVCGDNGCGGSCGTCPEGLECSNGQCCESGCGIRECGEDACGNPCGVCPLGYSCNTLGSCELTQCLGTAQPSAPSCGGITEYGCCELNGYLLTCVGGALYCTDCGSSSVCGWLMTSVMPFDGYYSCGVEANPDPFGGHPRACP